MVFIVPISSSRSFQIPICRSTLSIQPNSAQGDDRGTLNPNGVLGFRNCSNYLCTTKGCSCNARFLPWNRRWILTYGIDLARQVLNSPYFTHSWNFPIYSQQYHIKAMFFNQWHQYSPRWMESSLADWAGSYQSMMPRLDAHQRAISCRSKRFWENARPMATHTSRIWAKYPAGTPLRGPCASHAASPCRERECLGGSWCLERNPAAAVWHHNCWFANKGCNGDLLRSVDANGTQSAAHIIFAGRRGCMSPLGAFEAIWCQDDGHPQGVQEAGHPCYIEEASARTRQVWRWHLGSNNYE